MNLTRRWRVFERDAFSCQYCGRSAPHVILQVDHIEPRSHGGSDDISNLVTACWACNQGKKDRDGRDGLTMKSWQKSQWADRRAEAMLDILVAAYAEEVGCTTGDVVEWLDGEVA